MIPYVTRNTYEMKKIILLLALAMMITLGLSAAAPTDGISANYTKVSQVQITDFTINGTTRVGFKLGTASFTFSSDYEGPKNLRIKSNIEELTFTGKTAWGNSTVLSGNGQQWIRVNGQWIQYNNGKNYYTVAENVKGKTVEVELFFMLGSWYNGVLLENVDYTIPGGDKYFFSIALDNVGATSGNSNAMVELPIGDNQEIPLFDGTLSTDGIGYDDEWPEEEPEIELFTALEKVDSYKLAPKSKVEIASIIAWGKNVKEATPLSVKITHASVKNKFELVHEAGDSIPYSLYAGNEKVENDVALSNPKPEITSSNVSQATGKEIKLYAQLDVTAQELTQKRAGSYTDTIYIEISIDA